MKLSLSRKRTRPSARVEREESILGGGEGKKWGKNVSDFDDILTYFFSL